MRLTKWEGIWHDGKPCADLVQHDGLWAEILQPALRKLARYEDEEERHATQLRKEGHPTQRHHSEEDEDDHQRE